MTAIVDRSSRERLPGAAVQPGAEIQDWSWEANQDDGREPTEWSWDLDPQPVRARRSRPSVLAHPAARKVPAWFAAHWVSLTWALPLVAITAVLRIINLGGSPQRVDDEGTYAAQAYTVSRLGELTHYTYWYDHPPLGWIQMAAWDRLTGAFDRHDIEVLAQREFMVVASVVSAALLFVVARRLEMSRPAAAAAVAIFALSPLAVQYQRTVFLDNVATPWLLASLVLALAPKRQLAAFAAGAVCFAIAVLSKETYLLFLPCFGWLMWRAADPKTRRYTVSLAAAIVAVLGLFYGLMALLKGELMPGSDRASLATGLYFQLIGRQSSGSVLEAGSGVRTTIGHWLLDPAILVAGLAAAVLLLVNRRFRPLACVVVLAGIVGLRPGYLPVPYVIGLIPFFAILIPAAVEVSIRAALASSSAVRRWVQVGLTGVVAATAVAVTTPIWAAQATGLIELDHDQPMRQAEDYVRANVSREARLIVDDATWLEMVEAGFERSKVVWFYKVDTDPDVTMLAPNGWRDYEYVISTSSLRSDVGNSPILADALSNSIPLASFGVGDQAVTVRRVRPEGVRLAQVAEARNRRGRIAVGRALAETPALQVSADSRRRLVEGRVDARVLLSLRAAASSGSVTVAAIPAVPGEDEAKRPRRQVLITELDDRPIRQAPASRRLIEQLEKPPARYPAPTLTQTKNGLLVSYPGDEPAGLLTRLKL